ncbi:MAG TPA: hypothetical protein VM327_02935 [Candidatus Thermoplasmatota archaeon]|nr:hypothetical protein [Candidatus Thermoplasmatota archaeon]
MMQAEIDQAMAGGPRTRYEITWFLQQAAQLTGMQLTEGALRQLIGDGAADFDGCLQWNVKEGLVRETVTDDKGENRLAYEVTPLGEIVATAYRSGMVAVMRFQAGALGQDRQPKFRQEKPWMFAYDEPRDMKNGERAAAMMGDMSRR